jgi:glycosyltransferase involved in cell wall biosynthesis
MARLLYVGSGNPWQGGAGFLVRQSLFLSALGKVTELHLAMFDYKPGPVPDYIKSVTALTKPIRSRGSRMSNGLADMLDPRPRMFRGYDCTAARQQIRQLDLRSFDALFSYRIDFGYFAGVLHHPRLILDIDDPEHIRGRRRLSMNGKSDPRTEADLEKLRIFEMQAVAGAKLAFVCQENDRDAWAAPPEVVPNCVSVPSNPPRAVTRPIVLFVGNSAGGLTNPNVDAVNFFLTDIWPQVLAAVPDAEFRVVGAASDTVKQLVAGAPQAQLLGFVDNLDDQYAQAAVSIAPIRFGTGTRVKILEAFAHACPVVSTLAGAEGIEAIPGKEIELGVQSDDFTARLVELLRDRAAAEMIGQAGHDLVAREYNIDIQRQKLIKRFRQFLPQRAAK